MEEQNKVPDMSSDLRKRAEEMLLKQHVKPDKIPPADLQRTFHELEVHQIELEMQNEELRRTQKELEASRNKYFDLYDLAPVGYVTLNEKGIILEANLTAATLMGIERSYLVGQPLTRIILREDQDLYYLCHKQLVETNTQQACEIRVVRKDGTPFWVRLDISTMQGIDDTMRTRVVMVDIGKRKQAEQRQALLAEILGILNDPSAMDDALNRILAAIKLETGFDAVGIRLHHGDDFPYIAQDGFSKEFLLTENTLSVRTRDGGVCLDKDGNIRLECTCGLVISGQTDPANPIFTPRGSFWTNDSSILSDIPTAQDPRLHPRNRCIHEGFHSVALIPLPAGKQIIGILQLNDRRPNQFTLDRISFFEDLGATIGIAIARKQAEDELLEASNKLQLTLRAAELGAWDYDFKAGKVFWDEHCRDMFGVAIGSQIEFDTAISLIHPEDRPATGEAVKRAITGADGGSYQRKFRVVWSDGSVHWVASYGRVFFEGEKDNRRAVRFIGVDMDITDQKKLEEMIRQYSEKLEQSNRELDNFASIAAHDLGAPLRAVSGFAGLLQKRYKEKLGADADQYISNILEGIGRMKQLINDLLQYARVGTREKSLVPVDVNSIIEKTLANLMFEIQESRTVITVDPLPTVSADSTQLIQLFQNLVGNAIKYRSDTPHIHISAELKVGEWLFRVSDNGIGIDPQYFYRIFDIFQRLHTMNEYSGTGIGLATCKKIVERLGGRIWVESKPGEGSTFFFTLPKIGS